MEEVSLHQLLAARERRVEKQKALIGLYPGAALICLTVNTPGPIKRLPAADRVFAAGRAALDGALSAYAAPLRRMDDLPTGREGFWVVEASAEELKRLCCELEESLPYGRLLDADVLDSNCAPLSRTALNLPPRGCMVCGRPGAFCASRRLHALPELMAAFSALAEGIR